MDQATQYYRVEKIFKHAVHKSTNHSKTDMSNTINENKQLKAILKRQWLKDSLFQYMGVYFYRHTRLRHLKSDGEKVFQFLNDRKSVYPGGGEGGFENEET